MRCDCMQWAQRSGAEQGADLVPFAAVSDPFDPPSAPSAPRTVDSVMRGSAVKPRYGPRHAATRNVRLMRCGASAVVPGGPRRADGGA